MTICERCNTENLDGSQYCDECGAPLGVSISAKKAGGANDAGSNSVAGKSVATATPASALPKKSEAAAPQGTPAFAISQGSIAMMDGAHARLVIERGRSAGKQFPLSDEESQIGRWDADGGIFPDVDLDADDPEAKVSRRHARIVRRNGQYYIEDLGSTNGTFINRGRRLLPGDRQPLRDGDEIIVGKTFLRFHVVK
jgi:pSer/pThr/pTyr-binding forkhead associated (FHA) protein